MQKDAAGQPVPTVISARSPIGLLLACAMACLPLVAQAQQGLRLPGTEERSPYSSASPFGQDGPELPRSGGTSPLEAQTTGRRAPRGRGALAASRPGPADRQTRSQFRKVTGLVTRVH